MHISAITTRRYFIDGGESVKVVQQRLGHASAVETLRTYTSLWPSSDERTRAVVGAAWAGARVAGVSQPPAIRL